MMCEGTSTPPHRCVIRIRTTWWNDKRGLHTKKSLTFLQRQCVGYNILEDDADIVGAESVIDKITNLDSCSDGVYEVRVCNEYRDWETGYVDDWEYVLIPLDLSQPMPPPNTPTQQEPFDLEAEVEDMNRRLGGWK